MAIPLAELNAYHEAGHAVIGHVRGWRIKAATSVPETYRRGSGAWSLAAIQWESKEPYPETPENRSLIEERVREVIDVHVAGLAAARVRARNRTTFGGDGDLGAARKNAASPRGLALPEEAAARYVEERVDAIEQEVGEPATWAAIVAFATALLEQGDLTGDEARAIIDAALTNRTPSR